MPGFIGGGSSGSSTTGGEIQLPKEFIDPVTKIRVSQPSNLIDTDFEYGLQPTKWETVELINNTPSFFSKSGDTTIPDILSIITNAGTREIIVRTENDHNLAVGIPINVTGTKSVTADGSYIINSIPNSTTFTYLCKDIQPTTASIEDLYSSIITGEFFQGSQIRISDSEGITTDGEAISTLTVKTPSPHGFGVNTPFYFLNLNSTVSQEFAAANTETKSFDASNSATAQTFDGSNTLSSINIDWSNSAVVGGVTSSISSVDAGADTITVSHGTENFSGRPLGTPLYYNVVAAAGYFASNPRGVVFLRTTTNLGTNTSTFQVSQVPNGDAIDIVSAMTGTFQLANQARTFAGNNINPLTEQVVDIQVDPSKTIDAANTLGQVVNVTSFSAGNVNVQSSTGLADLSLDDWYFGTMVFYTTTGAAPTGLTNNTTYFIDSFFQQGTSTNYTFTLKPLPNQPTITSISGGSGAHSFRKIGVSIDKNIFHVKNNGYVAGDMLKYDYPVGGRFTVASVDQQKNYYFVSTVYDSHNFTLNHTLGELLPLEQSRTGTNAGTAITPTEATINGFTAPYTFSVISGTLPTGLSLNTSTGVISGTPTETTPTRTVITRLVDSTGSEATQTFTFQFNPQPNLYSFSSMTLGSTRSYVGANNSNMVSGASKSEYAQYFTNTGQTSNRSLIDASTYLDVPGAAGYVWWTVPQTATYRILARGGGGGNAGAPGGAGASVQADFSLTQGDVLWMSVGHSGGGGNFGGGDQAGGAGGGFTVVARSSSTSKSFNGSTMTPLLVAGGGTGAREPRFGYSPGYSDASQGGGGGGFYSNWRSQSINGSGAGYGGMTSYGGFGGGTGTDDGYGPAGGYDGIYSGSPNSYIDGTGSNQQRNNSGGGGAATNGSITITRL